jgi:uncharacterized protein YdcH (DUF465 family)
MDVRLVLASLLLLSVTATAQGEGQAPAGTPATPAATKQDPDKPGPQVVDVIGELTREKERLQQEIDYARQRAKGAKAMLAEKLGRRGQAFQSIDAGTNVVAPTATPMRREARVMEPKELDGQPDDVMLLVNGQPIRQGAFDEMMNYLRQSPSSGDDALRAQRVLFDLIRTQSVVAALPEDGAEGQIGDVLGQIENGKPIADLAKTVGTVQGAQEDGSVEVTRNSFLGTKIEQVAFTLAAGTRSRPVRTPTGIVIVQVDSIEKGASPELDKVKAHIVQVPWQADPAILQKAQGAAAAGQVEILVRNQEILNMLPALFHRAATTALADNSANELKTLRETLAKLNEAIAKATASPSPDSKSQIEQMMKQREQLQAMIVELRTKMGKEAQKDADSDKVEAPVKPLPVEKKQ